MLHSIVFNVSCTKFLLSVNISSLRDGCTSFDEFLKQAKSFQRKTNLKVKCVGIGFNWHFKVFVHWLQDKNVEKQIVPNVAIVLWGGGVLLRLQWTSPIYYAEHWTAP